MSRIQMTGYLKQTIVPYPGRPSHTGMQYCGSALPHPIYTISLQY